MLRARWLVVLLAAAALPAATALAELPGPRGAGPVIAAPAPGSLAEKLERHPQCREFSTGCEICVRTAPDTARCSTPGIACTPSAWGCAVPADDAGRAAPSPVPLR